MLDLETVSNALSNTKVLCLLAFILAYFISVRTYPVIIYLSRKKNLMDDPEGRSSHSLRTPTLGGVGLFITFSVTLILMGIFADLTQESLIKLLSILGGVIILLFLGIKDDLIELSPKKKLMGQFLSSMIVVTMADARIEGLFGLFGIGEIPYFLSISLSILVFIFIINAFNLIDGIDGLAGSVGTLASLVLGAFFIFSGNVLMALVSVIIIAGLVGFLTYNLSEKENKKLFMGDSGSMFIGFLLAYKIVSFLGLYEATQPSFMVPHPLILVLAVLTYPLLDTCRVVVIRLMLGKNPLSADKNHIHHRLVYLGLSHKQATILIIFINALIIASTFLMGGIYLHVQLYIVAIVFPIVVLSPFLMDLKSGRLTFTGLKLFGKS